MMQFKVTITQKADKDEIGIYKYISEEFGEIYADKFRQKLILFFNLLSKQPFIGRPAKNDTTLRVYLFSKQNKVVYKVIQETVVIIRILHTKTNLASKF